MNRKIIFAMIAAMLLILCGCTSENNGDNEVNPDEFGYDMLDLSVVADEIYENLDLSELTRKSIVTAQDETFITEQFYLDLENVISYEIRYAEGNYGAADVAIIRVKEGKAAEVMESLENRKDDRINEFRKYDVYDSYDIAMNAEIYEAGELVVMLMLSDEEKTMAMDIIDYYLP